MRNSEKHELTEEAHRLAKTIQQMEASLDDAKPDHAYEVDNLNTMITFPLNKCIQGLKEKYNVVHRLHKERFEQVKSKTLPLPSLDLPNRLQNLWKLSSHIPHTSNPHLSRSNSLRLRPMLLSRRHSISLHHTYSL